MVDLDNNSVRTLPLESKIPPKQCTKLIKALKPVSKIYKSKGYANLLDNLDLAFYNAPPPDDSDDLEPLPTEEAIMQLEVYIKCT